MACRQCTDEECSQRNSQCIHSQMTAHTHTHTHTLSFSSAVLSICPSSREHLIAPLALLLPRAPGDGMPPPLHSPLDKSMSELLNDTFSCHVVASGLLIL